MYRAGKIAQSGDNGIHPGRRERAVCLAGFDEAGRRNQADGILLDQLDCVAHVCRQRGTPRLGSRTMLPIRGCPALQRSERIGLSRVADNRH